MHQDYVSSEPPALDHETVEHQRLGLLTDDFRQLRNQFNWLRGLSIGMLILSGVLSAVAFSLLQQKDQLEQQVGTLTSDKAGFEQVKDLDLRLNTVTKQVKSLDQQVPNDLSNQLQTNQTQIQDLQAQLSEATATTTAQSQAIAALQSAVQQQASTTNATPKPNKTP